MSKKIRRTSTIKRCIVFTVLTVLLATASWSLASLRSRQQGERVVADLRYSEHMDFRPRKLEIFKVAGLHMSARDADLILDRCYKVYKWEVGNAVHALRLTELISRHKHEIYPQFLRLQVLFTHQKAMDVEFSSLKPLLIDTVDGIGYRTLQDRFEYGQPHADNLLAEFGELGLPLYTAVETRRRLRTLGDCLADSMSRSLSKGELDWTVPAYCSYLKSGAKWKNRSGERDSMNEIAARLLRRPIGTGSCRGTHREYALARLAATSRVDPHFVKDSTKLAVETELLKASKSVSDSQLPDGSWGADWSSRDRNHIQSKTDDVVVDVTAHILEWSSICPEDLRPSDDVLSRGYHFLLDRLKERPEIFNEFYSSSTHAVRALLQLSIVEESE